jgi:hypothetical protein
VDVLGAPVVGAAHALDPARFDHAIESDGHVRRRNVEGAAELLLVHVAVRCDQHQDRELGDAQLERRHVRGEDLAQLERGARGRVADQVLKRAVVELARRRLGARRRPGRVR